MSEFYWSTNEERYGTGPFDTREAAVADAIAVQAEPYTNSQPGSPYPFWTAKNEQAEVEAVSIDADSVLEQLSVDAYDLWGEVAEEWPEGSQEKTNELGVSLNKVLHAWLKENSPPLFWIAVDAQKHEDPE